MKRISHKQKIARREMRVATDGRLGIVYTGMARRDSVYAKKSRPACGRGVWLDADGPGALCVTQSVAHFP